MTGTIITTVVSKQPMITFLSAGQGPAGPKGDTVLVVGDGTPAYIHTQTNQQIQWLVNHNLGYKPAVSVFSVGGVQVMCEVIHQSNNQTTIYFDLPYAGTATFS